MSTETRSPQLKSSGCCREDEEIIHLVAFHKVVLLDQCVTGFFRFADHDLAVYSVVFAVSIAVDDSDSCARPQSGTQVAQKSDRMGDLVIGLEQQHGVNGAEDQFGVVSPAENSLYVWQMLFPDALINGPNSLF